MFERPKTASLSLLLLFAAIVLAQLAIILSDPGGLNLALGPVLAFVGIVVILNMPLRDPGLPNEEISPVYSAPTVQLRTPEDNLTPLQYMTVSWMSPLIQKGITRKMDDEDVWDLGWEFKHARLHEAFRKLEGSVTRRVFEANGMDAVRTTSLNLLRLCASKSCSICIAPTFTYVESTIDTGPSATTLGLNEGSRIAAQSCDHVCFYLAICTPAIIAVQCL